MNIKDIYMYVLGAIVILGFMALLGLLIFHGVPEGNHDLLYIAVGSLVTMASAVVGYFYGSSKGSADKNELLKPKQ